MPPEPEYANPDVPHEVNVSERSPIRDFLRLSIGLFIIVVVVTACVFFSARWWAPLIPFRYEEVFVKIPIRPSPCEAEGERLLQALADDLAAKMKLPSEMKIRVHVVSGKKANAYAMLGGNVFVFKGLLESVHSENALAMVLAHEIGHIKNRDPIVSMGGGVAVAVLFSALIGAADDSVIAYWAAGLTQMSFSRDQEEKADQEALAALKNHYGYTDGADEFFDFIAREHPELSKIPTFVSTHPSPSSRLRTIRATFSPGTRDLQPLPEAIRQLCECTSDKD